MDVGRREAVPVGRFDTPPYVDSACNGTRADAESAFVASMEDANEVLEDKIIPSATDACFPS